MGRRTGRMRAEAHCMQLQPHRNVMTNGCRFCRNLDFARGVTETVAWIHLQTTAVCRDADKAANARVEFGCKGALPLFVRNRWYPVPVDAYGHQLPAHETECELKPADVCQSPNRLCSITRCEEPAGFRSCGSVACGGVVRLRSGAARYVRDQPGAVVSATG